MDRIRFFMFFFCLIGINGKTIINTQYSQDLKYCATNENASFGEKINNIVDSLSNIANSLSNIWDNLFCDYNSYSDWSQSKRDKEKIFKENFPTAYLQSISLKYNCNCFIFDMKIDIFDDGTLEETPYNIRPLK